jgi:hypothetical protein
MPLNLLKVYNKLLEIDHLPPAERTKSLRAVFDRDIANNTSFRFRRKPIRPTTIDGQIPMDTLFAHLTTTVTDEKTKKREFERNRSIRLHWVKYHIDGLKKENMLVFSVIDPNGKRTYIYDKQEFYVIILEPMRNTDEYYLLTAYHLNGGDKFKIEKKYKRRLNEVL